MVRCPHGILLASERAARWRTLAQSSVKWVTPPPIICGSYRGSLDIQDVIGVLGTRMVGIGDREGVA
jgi:hypothetical protein